MSGVTPITGGRAITVPAIAVRLNIANMIGERSDTAMIDVAGASNVVSIGNAYFQSGEPEQFRGDHCRDAGRGKPTWPSPIRQ